LRETSMDSENCFLRCCQQQDKVKHVLDISMLLLCVIVVTVT
jgi:hypothetical protein